MMVTFNAESSTESDDPPLAEFERPSIKIDWGDTNDDEEINNSISFYSDGYVETGLEVTRDKCSHPADADQLNSTLTRYNLN